VRYLKKFYHARGWGAPDQFPVAWERDHLSRSARAALAVFIPASKGDSQQPLLALSSPFSFETAGMLALAQRKLFLLAHFRR
jgi:hypothetical protein